MRILVVEDNVHLNQNIAGHLNRNHYTVDSCFAGTDVGAYLMMAEYDALILDIMLPGKDGMDILKEMREGGNNTPVLILTARDQVEDKVRGLDGGADDYLVKPFEFEELLARIRLITRKKAEQKTHKFELADLSLDCDSRTVSRSGKQIALSGKEFSILEYFMRNQGIVLSRSKIEQHIWSYDYEGSSNMIDVYIRYLRKKIDEGFEPKLIHTVWGVGYVMRMPEGEKS